MSTHWDIYCRTCDECCGFHINHGERELGILLSDQKHWAALAEADLGDVELSVNGDHNGGLLWWPKFAKEHSDHDVTLLSEYGEYDDECSAQVSCHISGCGGYWYCRLPRGHEGEHRNEKEGTI